MKELFALLEEISRPDDVTWVIPEKVRAVKKFIREKIMPSQQIICLKCAERPLKKYPGEWSRREPGKARADFVCDACNTDIPKGAECVAQSFGLDRTPWYPWEIQYIIPNCFTEERKHETIGSNHENPGPTEE
jgi:hypothetical protein